MIGKHFFAMRQELAHARSIHESAFPKSFTDGYVRFNYAYAPMRDIGGDYIHLHAADDGRVHLTLLDVTGHGLAAALTVNRVYGELERIRAELPDADPAEVLNMLNRYFHLTLAKHGVFATAACVTVDPTLGRMYWASAGHPPGFLRGAGGAVTELGATTLLLGAAPETVFDTQSRIMDLVPGDTLVVYTDGAFEARNQAGDQFGLDQLRTLIRSSDAPRDWPQYLSSAVRRHMAGPAEDDVLIASLHFLAMRPEHVLAEQAESRGAVAS